MTPAQVQARLDKRTSKCTDECPGWAIVATARRDSLRIMACPPCNTLAPKRLEITDAHARMIPAAHGALNVALGALEAAARRRRRTVHAAGEMRETEDGNGYVRYALCGRNTGRTPSGKRTHVIGDEVTCTSCLRLLAETPEQRAEREAVKTARFDELRKRKDATRAALAAEIEAARPDALVALDAFLEGRMYPDAGRLLTLTVEAYKLEHPKSRGDRHWVFESHRKSTNGYRGLGDVNCRYCRATLAADTHVGTRQDEGALAAHTVECALYYLGYGAARPRDEETP